MATQFEQSLQCVKDTITRELQNGEYFVTEYGIYRTKSNIDVSTSFTGNLIVHFNIDNRKLCEKLEREADEKQASIYEEKARTLCEKWR